MMVGGADSFNLLVPTCDVEYNEYKTARKKHAISPVSLLTPITTTTQQCSKFGVNSLMTTVSDHFKSNEVCKVCILLFDPIVTTLLTSITPFSSFRPFSLPTLVYSRRKWTIQMIMLKRAGSNSTLTILCKSLVSHRTFFRSLLKYSQYSSLQATRIFHGRSPRS